jgi:hypothetical protein
MADYYQLITKAVAGLDPDAPGESRRALYERAQWRPERSKGGSGSRRVVSYLKCGIRIRERGVDR